tara:strand:- start:996 stop:2789 length:1794 start_codon:yes stop_codon:yes gene_type:complete
MFAFLLTNICLAQSPAKIEAVNFLQEGEVSKLIIDVSKDVVSERSHIKADKQILLDIKNVTGDKRVLRGIDTSEFSGATVFVSPYKKPGSANDIRFAIQLRDNVRSFIERRKNRIILHIENRFGVFTRSKLKKAEEQSFSTDNSEETKEKIFIPKSNSVNDILENLTQSGVKRYVGRKISINVNNLSYPEVLKMIADTSGFNIIIEDEVAQLKPLTINLTNLPWDQVLDTVMDLGGLIAFKHGNILTIKTEEKARLEKQAELDAQKTTKTLEPLVTKIFPISYAALGDISKVLADYSTEGRGSIVPDDRTQSLIVKDTVDVIERMKKIVEVLDTQTPQILIQAKVIEASENYTFRAGLGGNGVNFSYDPFGDIGDNSGTFQFSSVTTESAPGLMNASIAVFKRITDLNFRLDLMESESKVKIISSPKVITENNKAATISASDTRNFITQAAGTAGLTSEITALTAQTSLNVTPKVTNEGSILMNVSVTKSGFGAQTDPNAPPAQTSNSIATNVMVDNGSTIVIGGIYSTSDSEAVSGIPFLKDLPIIGWLFKTAYNPVKSRSELVVFITPRVINQEEAGLVNREDSFDTLGGEGLGL